MVDFIFFGSRFFVYRQVCTHTEKYDVAIRRIFGKFGTDDLIKCRLEILREATNWDNRTNEIICRLRTD
jgi:hypothetical protein